MRGGLLRDVADAEKSSRWGPFAGGSVYGRLQDLWRPDAGLGPAMRPFGAQEMRTLLGCAILLCPHQVEGP